jgi:hypothetical protein
MITPDELVEIERIKALKYRYLRFLDLKEWDDLARCFTGDATASYGGGEYAFDGRDAIMEFLRTALGSSSVLTSHKCHHPEIELTGTTSATGVWALEDVVIDPDQAFTLRGAAYYADEYEQRGGAWLIRHTGYKRVYEEIEPRSADLRLVASWWGTGGRSAPPSS